MMKAGFKKEFGEWGHDKVILAQARKEFEGFIVNMKSAITFARGSETSLNPRAGQQFATEVKTIMAKQVPTIPMTIVGYHLPGEMAGVGKRRAENLVKAIEQAGFPDGLLEEKDGGLAPAKSPTDKSVGINIILDTNRAEREFLAEANNFPIVAHEFGHMLGLPDEYEAKDADAADTECNKCAAAHGITVPSFSSNTSSLMSMGDKFLPYHYTPIVDAIERMAHFFRVRNPAGTNGNPKITIPPDLLTKVQNLYENNQWLRDFARMNGM